MDEDAVNVHLTAGSLVHLVTLKKVAFLRQTLKYVARFMMKIRNVTWLYYEETEELLSAFVGPQISPLEKNCDCFNSLLTGVRMPFWLEKAQSSFPLYIQGSRTCF